MNVGLHQDACLGVFSMWCFPAEEEGTMLLYYCKPVDGGLSRISELWSITIEMGAGHAVGCLTQEEGVCVLPCFIIASDIVPNPVCNKCAHGTRQIGCNAVSPNREP